MAVIERIFVPCGSHRLEALYSRPAAGPEGRRRGIFVLCHPYPPFGGDMYHKVVVKTAEALGEEGFDVLRFNFRGVGRSTGGGGMEVNPIGSREDLERAAAWARERLPDLPLWVGGYSYGAFIALSSQVPRLAGAFRGRGAVRGVLAVAYPAGMEAFRLDHLPDLPLALVHGTDDLLASAHGLRRYLETQRTGLAVHWVEGANHFFDGKLDRLKEAVRAGARELAGG